MDIPMIQEAGYHFLAGVSVAFADRMFSKNAKRHTEERLEGKIQQLDALKYLADNSKNEGARKTPEFLDAIVKARDYYKAKGEKASVYRADGGIKELPARLSETFEYFRENERINNQPVGKKLAFSFGLEIAVDAFVGASQILWGYGNGIYALGESLYQGPSFFGGLLAGKGILWTKDLFRSKDEKEVDEISVQIAYDSNLKLLEVVRSYDPIECHEVMNALPSPEKNGRISSKMLSNSVKNVILRVRNVGVQVGEGAGRMYSDTIEGIKKRKEERKNAEEAEKVRRRSKYDNY